MTRPMAAKWLIEATGMTGRQVDYWCRRLRFGWLGSGQRRVLSDEQVQRLRAIKAELDRHAAAMQPLLGPDPMPKAAEARRPAEVA